MLFAPVRSCLASTLVCLLAFWTLSLEVNCKSYHKRDVKWHNKTRSYVHRDKGFSQKKPRSAQIRFIPTDYSRQSIPVGLSSVPASSYRLPGVQRLGNVRSLAQLPALQRTYIPVVASSLPVVRYPGILRQGNLGTNRYILPYVLKMPPSRLESERLDNQEFPKHYNEKYNTLPSISNMDQDQDTATLGGKEESKKMDLDDDFDHFLDSLDGPCSRNPCKNGAKCRISREGNSFYCVCKRGFKGKTCEDKNPCFPNPCDNEGECTLTSEGFECSCPKGYKGKKCEQQYKCEPNPCENDGICNEIKNGQFECTCKKGFFGEKCQVSKKGCEPNPCLHDGHCSENENGDYQCTCAQGYTGKTCDTSDNKCINNPCKNGATCLQAMTSLGYECSCPRGFRGQNCEEHSGCGLNSCQNGGTCYETEFGVRCICKNGYSGDKCQVRRFCETDTCQNNGKCVEHANGFHCKCSTGYKGKMCEEMDRCHPNPCLHGGECEQSESGYLCKCTYQYQGTNCEVQNPCSRNPCKNNGKCLADQGGVGYQCDCYGGYRGKNCEERNACEANPCENNGVCRRNGNGFLCECQEGFEGKNCQTKDPCRNNPCQHGGSCKRSGDTDYTCLCPEDFKGFHCEARKPCHPNPCINDGTCEEANDDFTCSCKEGFRGKKCEEQDHCNLNPCKNGGRCTSLSASNNGKEFTCECVNSFYGDTCEERNPCHPSPCANNGVCTEVNGGFTCRCRAGYKGDRCHEIDKCSPSPCQHGGVCSEIIGGLGYACRCAYGYTGQDCEQKDHCHPNPCDHDGQCVALNNGQGFQCKCSPSFRGPRCSELNPCEPNPCEHDSQCISLPGFGKNHECNCSIGWSGETCQKREMCKPNPCQFGTKCVETADDSYSCVKAMCHPNPCENSGKCINVNENNFQCACTNDFEGKICEVPKRRPHQLSYVPNSPPAMYSQLPGTNNRIPSPSPSQMNALAGQPPGIPMSAVASCSPALCQNGGVCVQELGKPIRCKCKTSFTGNTCEVSKCAINPCRNGGMCLPVEREPGFVCKCRDGLTGPLCSRKPCEPNPCKNGGDCVMFYSVYLCKCKPGFEGKHCEGAKSATKTPDALEKEENLTTQSSPSKDNKVSACTSKPCENNARCVESLDGEFQCICPRDFSGPRCKDKGVYKYSSAPRFFPGENEECKHCDKNARCVNGHCICRNKYVGDGLECWEQTQRDQQWSCDRNPCQNGGTCKQGIARCVCSLGYGGDYCEEYSPPVVRLKFDKLVDGHKLVDATGNGNNAVVLNGFQIADKRGKCDNAGNMLGGDVLFDGKSFKGIPRRSITIAAWIKLTTPLGIQSIFDTIGSHSAHKDGQYHFEIDNGRVRWFHRNEMGKTVFSVVTDQPVVNQSSWTLITGTYSSKKNRARIFVNGDLIKEKAGRGLLLSGDWGAKAGIATLTELDVPINDEYDDDVNGVNNNNNIDQNSIIYQSLSGNNNNNIDQNSIIYQSLSGNNNNNNDKNSIIYQRLSDNNNNIDKNSIIYQSLSDNNNNNNIDKNSNIYQSLSNNDNSENNDINNPTIIKRNIDSNSKHEHEFGARVLRGMVDEFSIFPSELSRLQILVLMQHCKVYYNQIKQTTKTGSAKEPVETFIELPAPSTASYAATAAPYQASQLLSSQQLLMTAPPLQSNNYQPAYYQQPSNAPENGYPATSYYTNTAASSGKPGYTGYQRTQTWRPQVVPQYTPGSQRTGYTRPQAPNSPILSTYVQGSSSTGIPTQKGYQKIQAPKYPSVSPYALESQGRAMPAGASYVKSYTAKGPVVNKYPSVWTNMRKQEQVGTTRTQKPQRPIETLYAPAYQQGPSVSNPNVLPYNGYITVPNQQPNAYYSTLQSPGSTSGGKYDISGTGSTSQVTGNARNKQYSTPANTRGQQHNARYSIFQTPGSYSGEKYDVIATESTSQVAGSVKSQQYSPEATPSAGNTVAYQAPPQTNSASGGVKYTSVPQEYSRAQYSTAQNIGTVGGGQYQTIVPSQRGPDGQYEPLQTTGNTANSEYQAAAKGYIPSNSYQSVPQRSWPATTAAMTSSPDVRTTSYTSGLPTQPQLNAYAKTQMYPNQDTNSYQSNANNGYKTPTNPPEAMPNRGTAGANYRTASFPASNVPLYETSTTSYSTPSRMESNVARKQSLPRPASQYVNQMQQYANQKSQAAYVDNQMLARDQVTNVANSQNSPPKVASAQGQLNGPIYNNNNQYNPANIKRLDSNGQYPVDVQQYQNNAASRSGIYKSPTNGKAAYGRPLSRTFGTSGSQWSGYSQDGNSQAGSQTGHNSWSTASQTPVSANQWNPSAAPSAKQISQVGWTTEEVAKNTRGRYVTPQTSTSQWGMSSRQGAVNLATQLALDRPTLNINNQRLANDLAVEKPKVYKRAKIATHGKNS